MGKNGTHKKEERVTPSPQAVYYRLRNNGPRRS